MLLLFSVFKLAAQDAHFSQHYFNPLAINPAHTGFFNAKYRLVANYRDQWAFLPFPYSSFTFSLDGRLFAKKLKNNVLAIGAYAINDEAGTGNLGLQAFSVSMAYHQNLTIEGSSIGAGVQYGFYQYGFDPTVVKFGDQILNGTAVTTEPFTTTKISYNDINAGAILNIKPGPLANFFIGISFNHITSPKVTFYLPEINQKQTIGSKINFQLGCMFKLKKQFDITPSMLLMFQSASSQLLPGCGFNYTIVNRVKFKTGLWTRFSGGADAVITMIGVEAYDITTAFTYDLNVSSLRLASKGRGALELSLIYKGGKVKSSKKHVRKDPLLYCPIFDY